MSTTRRGIRAAAMRHADRVVGRGSTTAWLEAYTTHFTKLVEAHRRRTRLEARR